MTQSSTLSGSELQRRRPVWTTLSELWLDMELDRRDLERIAGTLADSGYSIGELDEIYLYEVAPVVSSNLRVPAGVWEAFDPDWLHAQVQQRAEHRSVWLRLWISIGVGRHWLTSTTRKEWEEIRSMMTSAIA